MYEGKSLRAAFWAVILGSIATRVAAQDIGFSETFALADDREKALEQLIPGTEEYYFYKALHLQNSGELDKVDEVLETWIEKHKRTARVVEIENRQALLRYGRDSEGALAFLKDRLGLRFDHQRTVTGRKVGLPAKLDPARLDRSVLTEEALKKHKGTLGGFEDRALEWVALMDIDADRLRHLIGRLRRPDVPELPRLIVADLGHRSSGGFGSLEIHKLLLLDQLEECMRLKPDLRNEANFVNIYLSKLRPSDDVDWRNDAEAREAYLDRLWSFVRTLNAAHNSLKVLVGYHRLVHDRSLGVYEKARFLEYLKLPRNVGYARREYLEKPEHRGRVADLRSDHRAATLLDPPGDDEPLVRAYLEHFFLSEDGTAAYEPYIDDRYLKRRFAETKILAGLGDMEKWYPMLPPAEYQRLKERVDIEFAPTNKDLFGPDEQVALDVDVKNVGTLIVKVFELNTLSYYQANLREPDTGIDLDGLVPNEEKTHSYDEPPLRRVRRHFEFPSLRGRGVFVIDFIGNGKSSRVVVRKGRLTYLERVGVAGHVFTVLDDSQEPARDARLWIAGHAYGTDEDGTITVPFTNEPRRQPFVLIDGDFASLDSFDHRSEQYQLTAGIHVARESLLKGGKATVAVRPSLLVNGTPVTLSVLEDPRLVITSVDREGVSATKEVKDFELFEDRESTHEFQVPANLATVQVRLRARVEVRSRNEKLDLEASRTFGLNGIEATDKVEDLFLAYVGGGYVVDLRGRNGERKPGRPVSLVLKHRDFRDPVHAQLETDDDGRVLLGRLEEIEWVRARGPEGVEHIWTLPRDDHSTPRAVHAKAGDEVMIPYVGLETEATRAELSLLEKRGGTYVRDRFPSLRLESGYVRVRGLPPGDYSLLVKDSGAEITLRVTEGKEAEGYVLSGYRCLQVRNRHPLQIVGVDVGDDAVEVRLSGATRFSRVHVIATRYLPEYPPAGYLGTVPFSEPAFLTLPRAVSHYVVGRDIGDEYRYILERKQQRTFAGNMLARPSLILNPWAIRDTATEVDAARPGEPTESVAYRSRTGKGALKSEAGAEASAAAGFTNLDFLLHPAPVLLNLQPDEEGRVSIARGDFKDRQHVHIVAVDPESTAYRQVSLPEAKAELRDLRLANALDPDRHYTEQSKISTVGASGKFVVDDVTTAQFEVYDSLEKVHGLFVSLTGNATLVEFGFVTSWPRLTREEKVEKYAKYACHELHFFLYHKDREFFDGVVKPHLRNKYHKTFLDHWLLGDDLREYLRPWAYARLNTVEQILLSQRIEGERPHTRRHTEDLQDLAVPDLEWLDHLFRTAVGGQALEAEDRFGLEEVRLQEGRKRTAHLRTRGGVEQLAASAAPAKPGKAAVEAEAAGLGRRVVAGTRARPATRGEALGGVKKDAAVLLKTEEWADRDKAARFFAADGLKLESARQLYRKLDKTKEWVENNYYHVPIEQQGGDLIGVNEFWLDYARHDGGAFYSRHLAQASRNFHEMMLALSVLDLPFEEGKHESSVAGVRLSLDMASPAVVYHKEITESPLAESQSSVLVSQNFFRNDDRYFQVGGEKREKYVKDEFLTQVVYGCHVVVTNPTSAPQKLDVLLQVPLGSIPVMKGQATRSVRVRLEPYRTWTADYFFYFPEAGKYPHYPVHVAAKEEVVAYASPIVLAVVKEPTSVDDTSWEYISQNGSGEKVMGYLEEHNLHHVSLDRIAWRMRDEGFFRQVLALLARRHVYNHTLWSYGIYHDSAAVIREYLRHSGKFLAACGPTIESELVAIDPVERKSYQHMEYWPLVNARAHRLGQARKILNDRFREQYLRLMNILCYRAELDDDDLMSVTCYLLLQDRVEQALAFFGRVRAERLAARVQYDYFDTYLAFSTEDLRRARQTAVRYAETPVERWRDVFQNALAQLDEIEGGEVKVVDEEDSVQRQGELAATEPSFDFEIEARRLTIRYQNLTECRVNYYLVDLELLFSRSPFVQGYSGQFTYIRPNATADVRLEPEKTVHAFDLPERFRRSNLMVEVVAAGQKKSRAYFSNRLSVQVIENYAQLRVTDRDSGKPLPKVYVKVYARKRGGGVGFYKDGYTDLRGRFDYGSLSTNEMDGVERFSMLVSSGEQGALVHEADPPKR